MKNSYNEQIVAPKEFKNEFIRKNIYNYISSIKEEDLVKWAPKLALVATLGYNIQTVFYLAKLVSPITIPFINEELMNYALDNKNQELLFGVMEINTGVANLPYVGKRIIIQVNTEHLLKSINSQNLELVNLLVEHANYDQVNLYKILNSAIDLNNENGKSIVISIMRKEIDLNKAESNSIFYRLIKTEDKEMIRKALKAFVLKDLETDENGNNIAHYYGSSSKLREVIKEERYQLPEKFSKQKNNAGFYPLDNLMQDYLKKKANADEVAYFVNIGAISKDNNEIFKIALIDSKLRKEGVLEKLLNSEVLDYDKKDAQGKTLLEHALNFEIGSEDELNINDLALNIEGASAILISLAEKTNKDLIERESLSLGLLMKDLNLAEKLNVLNEEQLNRPFKSNAGSLLNMIAENVGYYDQGLFERAYIKLKNSGLKPLESVGESGANVLQAAILNNNNSMVSLISKIVQEDGAGNHIELFKEETVFLVFHKQLEQDFTIIFKEQSMLKTVDYISNMLKEYDRQNQITETIGAPTRSDAKNPAMIKLVSPRVIKEKSLAITKLSDNKDVTATSKKSSNMFGLFQSSKKSTCANQLEVPYDSKNQRVKTEPDDISDDDQITKAEAYIKRAKALKIKMKEIQITQEAEWRSRINEIAKTQEAIDPEDHHNMIKETEQSSPKIAQEQDSVDMNPVRTENYNEDKRQGLKVTNLSDEQVTKIYDKPQVHKLTFGKYTYGSQDYPAKNECGMDQTNIDKDGIYQHANVGGLTFGKEKVETLNSPVKSRGSEQDHLDLSKVDKYEECIVGNMERLRPASLIIPKGSYEAVGREGMQELSTKAIIDKSRIDSSQSYSADDESPVKQALNNLFMSEQLKEIACDTTIEVTRKVESPKKILKNIGEYEKQFYSENNVRTLGFAGINLVESKESFGYWAVGTGYENYFFGYQPMWTVAYSFSSYLMFNKGNFASADSIASKNALLLTAIYVGRKLISSTLLNQDKEYTEPESRGICDFLNKFAGNIMIDTTLTTLSSGVMIGLTGVKLGVTSVTSPTLITLGANSIKYYYAYTHNEEDKQNDKNSSYLEKLLPYGLGAIMSLKFFSSYPDPVGNEIGQSFQLTQKYFAVFTTFTSMHYIGTLVASQVSEVLSAVEDKIYNYVLEPISNALHHVEELQPLNYLGLYTGE